MSYHYYYCLHLTFHVKSLRGFQFLFGNFFYRISIFFFRLCLTLPRKHDGMSYEMGYHRLILNCNQFQGSHYWTLQLQELQKQLSNYFLTTPVFSYLCVQQIFIEHIESARLHSGLWEFRPCQIRCLLSRGYVLVKETNHQQINK